MNAFRPLSRQPISLFTPFPQVQPPTLASTKTTSLLLQRFKSPSFQKISPALTLTNPTPLRTFTPATASPYHTSSAFRIKSNQPNFLQSIIMAAAPTAGSDQLIKLISELSLDQIRDKFPTCYPETNPVDVYRLHLTNVLEKITGVDPKIIYPAIQWTQGLDKGDVVVATPALRVKGKKPNELAEEWGEKVGVLDTKGPQQTPWC